MELQHDRQDINKLVQFGLTCLQARVYVSMYLLGEAPVKKIVDKCQMHRTEVYRVIKELESIGAIVPVLSRPIRYRATPPEELLKLLLVPQLNHLAQLTDAKKEILDWLEGQKSANGLNERCNDGFEVLRGKHVLSRMREMMENTSKEILYESQAHRYGVQSRLLGAFNKAVERGVRAKGVVNFSNEDLEAIKQLKTHRLIERKHNENIYSWMMITDRQEMIFGSAPTPLPDEEFIYTRNQKFIQHSIKRFEKQFETSTPLENRIRELSRTQTPAKSHQT